MKTTHVALVCSSVENADTFFGELLGLTKTEPKVLPKLLSEAIFHVASELKVVHYQSDGAHFEIFICDRTREKGKPIEHVCIEVADVEELLAKARSLNMETLRVQKGDSFLSFIYDLDNNLFEVKERRGE